MQRRRILRTMSGAIVGAAATPCIAPFRAFAAPPTEFVIPGVPAVAQMWNLSCEYAAASAATGLWGQRVTERQFHAEIGNHLNPHKGFRGDIANGRWGGTADYGVYPEPLVPVLRRHGFANSRAFRAGTDTLKRELAASNPVVVWIVGDYSHQQRVYLKDGESTYFVIPREHAVTLYGYDPHGVHLMDPAHGSKYHVSWESLEFAWAQLDHMGLIVAK